MLAYTNCGVRCESCFFIHKSRSFCRQLVVVLRQWLQTKYVNLHVKLHISDIFSPLYTVFPSIYTLHLAHCNEAKSLDIISHVIFLSERKGRQRNYASGTGWRKHFNKNNIQTEQQHPYHMLCEFVLKLYSHCSLLWWTPWHILYISKAFLN